MLDFGAVPPEINSARIDSGPGPESMMAAAAAWDVLANALESVSRGYSSVIARLQGESWSGGASDAMSGAVAPYVAWVTTAGTQAEEAASQARAAAAAYEAAFAATVPLPMVTANRAEAAALVATNVLGQNTGSIAALEAQYEQMWAQDAAAMYNYAASSSAATALRQFTEPPPTTNAAAQPAQTAAVAMATETSAAGNAQTTLSQLMSSVPQQLQSLAASGTSALSTSTASSSAQSLIPSSVLTAFSNFNTLTGPAGLASNFSRTSTSAMSGYTGIYRSSIQAGQDAAKAAQGAARAAAAANTAASAGLQAPVLANAGNATTVAKLSVPPSWAMTNPAVTPIADPHWLSDADVGGGPVWEEVPVSNMWNSVPAPGAAAKSGVLSGSAVNNVLRVGPRKFAMPRPSLGG